MGKVCNVTTPIASVNGISINRTKPCNATNFSNTNSRTVEYIVYHYTGNSKDTAWANANYFQSANRDASAHYFVDDENIYQSVDACDAAWHCGAYTYYHASCRNANSIGIEMCCTAGNYKIGPAALENAAQLGAALCKYFDITDVDKYVVRHYDVSHKKCPAQMAGESNAEWTAFKARIKAILNPVVVNTKLDFKVGDIVNFTGKTHYKSSSAAIGSACKAGEAKVTATSSGAKHQYHLIRVAGGTSTVYGWVDAADVKKKEAVAVVDNKIDTVKEVQTWLNSAYSVGLTVDGIYGVKTRAALVKVLQKALKVTVDGVYGPETNRAIKNLNKGSTGDAVKVLQGLLVCNGYTAAYVDGNYGDATYNAVKAYQKSKKLLADGIAGKATFSALCK